MFNRNPSETRQVQTAGTPVSSQEIEQPPVVTADSHSVNQPLPRPARQKRRAKTDRGLPPDQELARLAAEYLRVQRMHWPDLVKHSLLPETEDAAIAEMVEDFKQRHRSGQVDPEQIEVFLTFCKKLAGSYNRFSCDNSNPTSIIDQLVRSLEKARQEDRFVPWAYVFCDYSVSGVSACRQGYGSYKSLLANKDQLIETTYVDDFTRASRDEIEWWRLAALSKRLGKRMIGASDSFDISSPHADVMITMYGLLSRLFLKGLREKVRRGMAGAARRKTCLGKLSLGFTRCAARNEHGEILKGADGLPINRPCFDEATREHRALLFELFCDKHWSIYRITKHFNRLKVDGWDGWTELAIKKLLWSATAIGVFIWNRTRRDYDHEQQKWLIAKNPRSQWVVQYDPNLAIVPIAQWKVARKRLLAMKEKSPLTGKKPTRNQVSAKTLFSGTLFCDYCGRELLLCRSTSKYKVMGCLNGRLGGHGCKLSTSKSTRIIEGCLLKYLQKQLLTEEAVERLVVEANAFLAAEAAKPKAETKPLLTQIRQNEATIKKLFGRVERQEDESLIQAYEKRIAVLQKEVQELKDQVRKADIHNAVPPPPLDLEACKELLGDLRGLLNQEIPAAAEAIRNLTGPIRIRQEIEPGQKRGAKWIATFSPNLLKTLTQCAKAKDCPESLTLEFLCRGIWTTSEPAQVTINHLPKYEEIAPEVKAMADRGVSIEVIARFLGETRETAGHALRFARTNRRPATKAPGKRTGKKSGPPGFKTLSAEVVRLRDRERLSFRRIAKMLNISTETAKRAYDFGKPQAVQMAAETGRAPVRGGYSHLGSEIFAKIEAGLKAGHSASAVAQSAGCGLSTVYRVRRRFFADGTEAA